VGNYDLVPIDYERPDPSTVIAKVKVPEGILKEYVQRAIAYYQANAKLPGFRPGFVPPDVVIGRFADDIRSDVINAVVPDIYREVLKRENVKVVGDPLFNIDYPDLNLPMTLTITLSLRPSVVIADYREIKLSRPEIKTTAEEVSSFIEHLREDNAELSPPLERASELGDVVTVLFHKERPPVVKERRAQMFIFKPEAGERFNTKQLAGHLPGDEADVTITYPEDYPATALAGKTIAYPVKIEEIRQRILPELDDQFATDLGAENLDDLRAKIKQEITVQKEAQVEENLLEQAWRSVMLSSTINISESMIKRFMGNSLAEGAQMPADGSPAFKEFHDYTLIRLKDFFLTDAVIANEAIKVEPEELKKERNYLLDMVKHKQISSDEVPNDEELEMRMLRRKARERVKERVKIA